MNQNQKEESNLAMKTPYDEPYFQEDVSISKFCIHFVRVSLVYMFQPQHDLAAKVA